MNSEDLIKAKLLENNTDNMNLENAESNTYTNDSKHIQEYPTSDIKILKNTSSEGKENVDHSPDTKDGKNDLKKCCFVELNKGISYFNLFSYYVVQFSYVCAFTFIDACQDYLLEDPNYYGIGKDEVGTINGDILLFDTLYLIAFIYIYGAFHDIFGRKIMVVYGFISMGISLALYPIAGKVYPNLIFVRLIFSNGICAVTTQPLLADYVNHKSRGFGGGIAAVVSGMGAIFAALFLLKLQSYMNLLEVYWVSAGICFGVAIVCAFGVKNVNRGHTDFINFYSKSLIAKLREGFQECKGNYPLCIGIATNSLARMNTLLITLFLVIWIKQHNVTQEESIHLGHMISGIGNSVGLISALLFGFLFEKKKFLILTNLFVTIGYVGFYLSPDPHHWLTLVSISCASFGFYGLMTIGYVMVNYHCGNKARGSIMGINCLFGAIALLILAKLGGLAFDKIDKSIPFLFASLGSAILLLIVLFTRSKVDVIPQHHDKELVNSGDEIKGTVDYVHVDTHVDFNQKI